MRARYVKQLNLVHDDLLRMGSRVEHALTDAMRALETWDTSLARHVVAGDQEIDEARNAIEEAVLELLATQQPVLATDLRTLNATIAIAGELERAGDYTKGIAKRVERCLRAPTLLEAPAGLHRMGALAQDMLHTCLDHSSGCDVPMARSLAGADERVDELEDQVDRRADERRAPGSQQARLRDLPDRRRAYLGAAGRPHHQHRRAGDLYRHQCHRRAEQLKQYVDGASVPSDLSDYVTFCLQIMPTWAFFAPARQKPNSHGLCTSCCRTMKSNLTMDRLRAHVTIDGRVQGVNFRASAHEQARSTGVEGWVRNLDDGRVEAVFEGPEAAVKRMISWCYSGPRLGARRSGRCRVGAADRAGARVPDRLVTTRTED